MVVLKRVNCGRREYFSSPFTQGRAELCEARDLPLSLPNVEMSEKGKKNTEAEKSSPVIPAVTYLIRFKPCAL